MIELLGLAIISVLVTEWFSPIEEIKEEFAVYTWPIIGKILYCPKCFGLWFGLIVTHDIYSAVIISLLAFTISYLIDLMDKNRYGN